MEVRPYLAAGAAIVSTGALVAALPAIVPSPTPPDVQVSAALPRSVYADVELTQFTTQALLNAIFSGFPDTNGPAGAVGVAAFLTQDIPLVTDFVNGGVVGLATALFGADPVAAAFLDGGIVGVATLLTEELPLVNSFFGGFSPDGPSGIVGVLDELTAANPQANAFVLGGIVGLARSLVADGTLEAAFLDGGVVGVAQGISDVTFGEDSLPSTFVSGGFVSLTEAVLLQAAGDDEVLATGIQSFFSGYPLAGPDDDPPAGPAGIVGLVHFVLDALTGGVQTEPGGGTGDDLVGGASVPETTLVAALTGPVGAQGPLEANETLTRSARTFNLNVATDPTTGIVDPADTLDPVDPTTVDTDPVAVDPVDTTEPVETTDPDPTVTPVGATTPGSGSGSLPAGQPPVSTPPTTDPIVDPVDPAPTDPVSNEEEEDGKQLTEEELKSGNKVTPDTILLETGTGGGGTAWDQTVQRWKDFGAKLGLGGGAAPAAPAAPSTPDTGGTDGGTDGAS